MPVILIICQSSFANEICKCDTAENYNEKLNKNGNLICQNEDFINNPNNMANGSLSGNQ